MEQQEYKITPEANLKNHIINMTAEMINSENRLLRYKRLNNQIINPNHLIEFSVNIISVWNYIKYMVDAKQIYSLDKSKVNDYQFLEELEYDRFISIGLERLIRAKAYIIFCLHQLGLLNILNVSTATSKIGDMR